MLARLALAGDRRHGVAVDRYPDNRSIVHRRCRDAIRTTGDRSRSLPL